MSAPALTAACGVLGAASTPQILTRTARSADAPHERVEQLRVAHERGADEQRIGAGREHGGGVGGRRDSALGRCG